jgi:hypothetical protein
MGGCLELGTLNRAMNYQGLQVGNELRFYTMVLLYAVTFGPNGAYMMERYNKFLGYWEDVQFSGTYKETITTLGLLGPFLPKNEITQFWDNVVIPPEPPELGPIFYPV